MFKLVITVNSGPDRDTPWSQENLIIRESLKRIEMENYWLRVPSPESLGVRNPVE